MGGHDSHKVKHVSGLDFWQNKTAFWGTNGTYALEIYRRASKTVLDNSIASGKPQFWYYAHQLIHEPLQIYAESVDGGKAAKACAHVTTTKNRNTLCMMTWAVDNSIGEFIGFLESNGMWDDTIMWLTTGNTCR